MNECHDTLVNSICIIMLRVLVFSVVSLLGTLAFPCLVGAQTNDILAFPGAEGYGAKSVGGRGGQVIEVTNLNDTGPGSLRKCIKSTGPRTCVFTTGGTIVLENSLSVQNPYITIAGQTAPGDGVLIRNGTSTGNAVVIKTHDVIIRYLRVRPGPGGESDALTMISSPTGEYQVYNIMIDHSSFSWAVDEVLSTQNNAHLTPLSDFPVRDITIQWNIISEGLHCSTHPKGCHSKGFLGNHGIEDVSLHHNLFAHNDSRNPRIDATGDIDIVNNVIYNPGFGYKDPIPKALSTAVSISDINLLPDEIVNAHFNIIGNYFKWGPSTTFDKDPYEIGLYSNDVANYYIYVKGNIGPDRPDDSLDDYLIVRPDSQQFLVSDPYVSPYISTSSATAAYSEVVQKAGANFPKRDSVDQRVANDVLNGTGKIIDDPSEVGGWPEMESGIPRIDTDHDGMPDDWEYDKGLNPSQDDSADDRDSDGYTNIEEYINELPNLIPSPFYKQLLSAWLTNDFKYDQNGDQIINSLDFAILINIAQ